MRDDLRIEREEKQSLIKKINSLKEKVYTNSAQNENAKVTSMELVVAKLEAENSRLNSELDTYKLRLIEKDLAMNEEGAER